MTITSDSLLVTARTCVNMTFITFGMNEGNRGNRLRKDFKVGTYTKKKLDGQFLAIFCPGRLFNEIKSVEMSYTTQKYHT